MLGTKIRFVHAHEYWGVGDLGTIEGNQGDRYTVRLSDGLLCAVPAVYFTTCDPPARRPLCGDRVRLLAQDGLPTGEAVVTGSRKGKDYTVCMTSGVDEGSTFWVRPEDFEYLDPEVIALNP